MAAPKPRPELQHAYRVDELPTGAFGLVRVTSRRSARAIVRQAETIGEHPTEQAAEAAARELIGTFIPEEEP